MNLHLFEVDEQSFSESVSSLTDHKKTGKCIRIDPESCTQNLASVFTCMICTFVLHEPISCKMCEKMFCGGCIQQCAKRLGQLNCPNCCKKFDGEKINRELRNLLEETEYKCANCFEQFKYTEA